MCLGVSSLRFAHKVLKLQIFFEQEVKNKEKSKITGEQKPILLSCRQGRLHQFLLNRNNLNNLRKLF
jgi:hypothetical protein